MITKFGMKESNFSVDSAFEKSFGKAIDVSDDSFGGVSKEYYNPWTGVDYREDCLNL